MSEMKVVSHGLGPAPVDTTPAVDVVRARREELRAKAAAEHAGAFLVEPEAESGPPREDVESVEVQLPGMMVEFGPPNGVSLSARLATFPMEGNTQLTSPLLRVLFCVRTIDGTPVPPVTNMTMAQRLANKLGDRALDLLAQLYSENWPPLSMSDLPTIKKNLRQ